jgi:uncharacterized membrane protein YcaP (DUF421 family)
MKKMRYTLDYLNQQLRQKDIFSIEEVQYALVENNGLLSVKKKEQHLNITRSSTVLSKNQSVVEYFAQYIFLLLI